MAVVVSLMMVVLIMCAAAYTLLASLFVRHEGKDSSLAIAFGRDLKSKISMVIYAVGIAAAFVQPAISLALYVIAAAIWVIPDRRVERMTRDL